MAGIRSDGDNVTIRYNVIHKSEGDGIVSTGKNADVSSNIVSKGELPAELKKALKLDDKKTKPTHTGFALRPWRLEFFKKYGYDKGGKKPK